MSVEWQRLLIFGSGRKGIRGVRVNKNVPLSGGVKGTRVYITRVYINRVIIEVINKSNKRTLCNYKVYYIQHKD